MIDERTTHPGRLDSRFLLTILVAALLPLIGTLLLNDALSGWYAASEPVHSTFEVMGAAFGLVLATVILLSRIKPCTSRRLKIVYALITMSVLDILHSCVSTGLSFVWLHSIAVLAGGIFFALVWLPEQNVPRNRSICRAGIVLLGSALAGWVSLRYPGWIPVMIIDGKLTAAASAINLTGGWLTILGGFAFARSYRKTQSLDDLVFLFLCLLFGCSGILFHYADIWEAGWWFWHVLRLGGYLIPFWLALFANRFAEDNATRNQIEMATAVARGDLTGDIMPLHDQDELGKALHAMSQALQNSQQKREKQNWLKTGIARLSDVISGALSDTTTLASSVIEEIATYIDVPIGALYITDAGEQPKLWLRGSYAFCSRKNLSGRFQFGEGLVGQAALEQQRILVKNVPEDYIRIASNLGECTPRYICVIPFLYKEKVKGVVELGLLAEPSLEMLTYLQEAADMLGLAVERAHEQSYLAQSLEKSQALAEELQTQQEELKTTNEELKEQTYALKISEEALNNQQEALQASNEELEEKTEYLERQKRELMEAKKELEEKADELARTSKYKSEFLANMSHELRTPLNSLLLLAGSLAENDDGNLTEDQVEASQIIQSSGKELLSLINETLDLSKIEAGKMQLHLEPVSTEDLADDIRRNFNHVFEDKEVVFDVVVEKDAPAQITSDEKRIGQILRNLMSNAIKFTQQGRITVTFSSVRLKGVSGLSVAVKDTGTGIPQEKLSLIFEAFRQAESGTARKYGGTGLGLSISKELARLLGGRISVKSEIGKGSVFTVQLPLDAEKGLSQEKAPDRSTAPTPPAANKPSVNSLIQNVKIKNPVLEQIPDDRNRLTPADSTILVVEDDKKFARILLKQCHEKDLKCLIASTGEEGILLAEKYIPSAIILDLTLPGLDGWSVLDHLKNNMETRHIPVHIMSAAEPSKNVLSGGAIGFIQKPVDDSQLQNVFGKIEDLLQREMKNLLVIEDDQALRQAVLRLIGDSDVIGDGASTAAEALEKLRSNKYDCVILDLSLPDMTGLELLEIASEREELTLPPIIVHTGRALTRKEEAALATYSESIIIKGVRSHERLFDEASLFLHRMVEKMPENKRKMIANLHNSDSMFRDKRVLIVDDDMRNLFALSNLLSAKGIQTFKADNGKKALEELDKNPGMDLVLMDIMMPVMDGYETMKKIRAHPQFDKLPIIALTAKAMQNDRLKCIEAGASDYLPKPIDMGRLLSMLRVWMYR